MICKRHNGIVSLSLDVFRKIIKRAHSEQKVPRGFIFRPALEDLSTLNCKEKMEGL